ncbi:MAG: PAS domain S-box protein [Lentimicrobiaceae bacterium]|nr:PAS domain S-box protein [Lentimicrobiaceae bacterium]
MNYEEIFHISPEAMLIINAEGKITECNSKTVQLFDYTNKEEIVGKYLLSFVVDSHKNYFAEKFNIANTETCSTTIEFFLIKKDGSEFISEISCHPIFNDSAQFTGHIIIIREITLRKKMEEEIMQSQEKFEKIFNNLLIVFFQVDMENIITEISPSVTLFAGYSREELIGTPVSQFYYNPEDRDIYINLLQKKEMLIEYEIQFKRKDNSVIWVSLNSHWIKDSENNIIGTEGTMHDISRRKAIEEKVKQQYRNIEFLSESATGFVAMSSTDNIYSYICNRISLLFPNYFIAANSFDAKTGILTNEVYTTGTPKVQEYFDLIKNYLPDFTVDLNAHPKAYAHLLTAKVFKLESNIQNTTFFHLPDKVIRILNRVVEVTDVYRVGIAWHNELYGNLTLVVKKDEILPVKTIEAFTNQCAIAFQRRFSEIALKKSEEQYKTLIVSMGEGVGIVNTNEIFVFTNPMAEAIFDVEKGKLIGRSILDFIDKEQISFVKSQTNHRSVGGKDSYELKIKSELGEEKVILVTATPQYDNNKQFIGTFGIFRDITIRKKQEEQIKKYSKELQEANATKDKFFSIIAHDLRSPFQSIKGLADLLYEDFEETDPDEMKTFLKSIRDTADNTYKLLLNLLEWANIQRGNIVYNPVSLDIAILVREAFVLLDVQTTPKNIKLVSLIQSGTIVLADERMLQTIIRNLVSNAIKFSYPKSEIILECQNTGNNKVEIRVKDNGIGMDEETVNDLFNIARKARTEGTANEKGSGLGLILCKEFIEKHNNTLWVSSRQGAGTTFHFSLDTP